MAAPAARHQGHGQPDVPVAIAHDLQPFRLLELPADLVELIESPNAPL